MQDHTQDAITAFLNGADRDKPLLICDADEVLLHFFETLEGFLERKGFFVQLDSFALNGNVRHKDSGEAANGATLGGLMRDFFETDIHTSRAVEGAPEALEALSQTTTICILTNLPGEQAGKRAQSLASLGMAYPVICNTGGKGRAVEALLGQWRADAAFIDDMPGNHDSVAEHAPGVHRIHYVANTRLSPLIDKPQSAHVRLHDWETMHTHLTRWAATD
ncbi:MAG: hypothetical protein AAF337_09765 [Pseudomonadota bacterium]